jgi:hypothetical protein
MSATITATGTWTPLNVDFTNMDKTDANVPHADKMQLEQLKAADLPELTQFVQAMADGYGIGFNPAKALFYTLVTAFMNRETPSVSRLYAA